MRRRDFVALLGGAAGGWPIATRAQRAGVPVVGWLDNTTASGRTNRVAAFRDGLSETGFVEGRNLAIEFRWTEGRLDRVPALVADLIHRQVAAIVTVGGLLSALKAATATIPIVFLTGADPVEAGFVTSLARPSGNVTGVSFTSTPLDPKRLELLHELVPKPAVIAALMDSNQSQAGSQAVEAAGRALGRQIIVVKAARESEFDGAFATIVQAGAGALFVGGGPFFASQRRLLVALAAHHRLPASYDLREFVEVGGLMSYGTSAIDAYHRGGVYVGRILKGERPGDLPVELQTRYELVISLATAKALKLDIPPKLLAIADEVIE